ncbi:MAG: hypothetical protein JWP89_1310 [Schlesneria sp.]|nr:hypothetical protein [Schlesneria sp.]
MSRKPFEEPDDQLSGTEDEQLALAQSGSQRGKDGDDFDEHAVLGDLDGSHISDVFEQQFVFDSIAAPDCSKRHAPNFADQSLPFDPAWAVESFVNAAEWVEKTLRNCLAKLSISAFDALEIELHRTVVASIWDVDFGAKVALASAQQQVRNEAVLSCISVERELSVVKGNLKSLVLLSERVDSERLMPPFESVGNALCTAHSNCELVLVDRSASCKALARALRLEKLIVMLGTLLLGLPTPSTKYDMERSLTAARDSLDFASATLAAPPFSGSHSA